MRQKYPQKLQHSLSILHYLVLKDFKGKYKTFSLGTLWAIFNPLFTMAVFMVVFLYLLRFNIQNYPVFLLAGIVPWTFFQNSWSAGTNSILENADLIKKINFPREIVVIASVISNFIDFLISFIVLFAVMAIFKIAPAPMLLFLPLIFIAQFCFVLGLSFITSALEIKFRDTRYILDMSLRLGFYVTPIIYSVSMIPERFHRLYLLNPMVGFTMLYRKVILGTEAHLLSPNVILYTVVVSALTLFVGAFVFKKLKKNFADYV